MQRTRRRRSYCNASWLRRKFAEVAEGARLTAGALAPEARSFSFGPTRDARHISQDSVSMHVGTSPPVNMHHTTRHSNSSRLVFLYIALSRPSL